MITSQTWRQWRSALLLPCLALSCVALASCADRDTDADRRDEITGGASFPMKPGRWETTAKFTEIDVPNLSEKRKAKLMAKMAKKASGSSCLTREQAEKADAGFFAGSQAKNCKYRKFDMADGKADFILACKKEGMGTLDTAMKGRVGESDYDMDVEMEMRLPIIGKIKLKGHATGEYKGACTGTE